jgi:hypothetical protein
MLVKAPKGTKDNLPEGNEMSEYMIEFKWDDDAGVWYAINDDIPIAMEAGSLDVLMERVKQAIPEILEMNGKARQSSLRFQAEKLLKAV